MKLGTHLILAGLCLAAVTAGAVPVVGPTNGTLVICGGGLKDNAILQRFIELAGGPAAALVLIPTANENDEFGPDWTYYKSLHDLGATNLVILHTRDRKEADSETFVRSLQTARGVWIGGGRQWRLVDSYLHTRTQAELSRLLARGGVIGGTSAGCSIQASYLVRGARAGNAVMMAPGYEEGFGFLRNVALDQHLLTRHRTNDLTAVVKKFPNLLGIGLDENTAIVVHGDEFEVLGASKVAIYDPTRVTLPAGLAYYFLQAGDRFNLHTRRQTASMTANSTPASNFKK